MKYVTAITMITHRLSLLYFIGLFLFDGNACSQARAQERDSAPPFSDQDFRQSLKHLAAQKGARAVIAGAWVGGQPIAKVALGESMAGVPAQTDMTIRIGGVSQLFLGTALMRLVERGEIALDDKISKWLPDLLKADSVTVGMLARNTAGYKDYVVNEDFLNQQLQNPFRSFSSEEIVDFAISDGEMNFEPGTSQAYSHTEFTILRMVLERATGRRIETIYRDEVLRPLGLSRTGYSLNPELPSPVLHAFSSDRGIYEDSTFWNPSWPGESGPLYSTLDDLGKWGPAFGKGKLLRPAFFQKLIERPSSARPSGPYFATCFVISKGWYFQILTLMDTVGCLAIYPRRT